MTEMLSSNGGVHLFPASEPPFLSVSPNQLHGHAPVPVMGLHVHQVEEVRAFVLSQWVSLYLLLHAC